MLRTLKNGTTKEHRYAARRSGQGFKFCHSTAYNVFTFKAEPDYAALNLLFNQAGLELWILPQTPKCRDYRCVSPQASFLVFNF